MSKKVTATWTQQFNIDVIMGWFVSHALEVDPAKHRIVSQEWYEDRQQNVVFKVYLEHVEPEPGKIPQPAIKVVVDELMKHPTKTYDTRTIEDIRGIVIHHTATDPSVGPHRCAEWHVEKNDWAGIGYHFMVAPDGTIYQTNWLETISAQAAHVNDWTVGIAFQGSFQEVVPTDQQIAAGAHLCAWLQQERGILLDDIKGHREHMATACPGNQWLKGKKWKDSLMEAIVGVKEEYSQ